MPAHCMATGAQPGFGRAISHSHRRTERRCDPDIQHERYVVPSLGRTVRLTPSARGINRIDRDGIEVVVARMTARGVRL